jgi:hypothetical protein
MNEQAYAGSDHACFVLDAFDPLAPFGYRRNLYSAALYGNRTTENPLKLAWLDARNRFRPNRPAPAPGSRTRIGLHHLHVALASLELDTGQDSPASIIMRLGASRGVTLLPYCMVG